MRNIHRLLLLLLFFAPMIPLVPFTTRASADEATREEAISFVEAMRAEGVLILRTTRSHSIERRTRFRAFLPRNFNIPFIARFVLGPNYRSVNNLRRDRYNRLFEEYLVVVYASRFNQFAGNKIRILRAVERNGTIFVRMVVTLDDGNRVVVKWRVIRYRNTFRIIDVIVSGFSILQTTRDEFRAVYARAKNIDDFLDTMEEKIKSLSTN